MSERCPACNADVVDAGVPAGGSLRCDRCATRFPKAKRAAAVQERAAPEEGGLGIHPALAKRYTHALPQAPKPQIDTRVLDGGMQSMPSAEGAPVPEPGTAPGRPARRSLDGPVPAAKPAAARIAAQATTAKAPPAEPLPVIPGFDVQEMIGKGAMGRVYRAKQLSTGRVAAIKTLAPELAIRADFVQRFEREGAAMRAIRHPGVVSVWDQGRAGADVYYIAMEYIEGHPLRKFLERGPVLPTLALRYTRLILQALHAAHTPGVIHRDLKPENILMPGLPGAERPVLVDFGLAGIMEEENDPHPNLTKSRMTMGTVNYMAPEQRTDAKRVDQRADLYAAGVILYELLTGDLPLGRFNLPTEKGLKVPASIDRLIIKALARNADERFQHARDFDAAIAVIEAELEVIAGPSSGRDTLVAGASDTLPGRAARPEVLRRESSEPGERQSQPAMASSSMVPSMAPSMAGTFAESLVQPAWVTMLPVIHGRFIGAAVALCVGTLLGLLLLRGF
ncbi:MAG: protein kinase [Deltaproteobacteria bacterium]|nr:protein kinase [Deltaproteobacteria bacterium]